MPTATLLAPQPMARPSELGRRVMWVQVKCTAAGQLHARRLLGRAGSDACTTHADRVPLRWSVPRDHKLGCKYTTPRRSRLKSDKTDSAAAAAIASAFERSLNTCQTRCPHTECICELNVAQRSGRAVGRCRGAGGHRWRNGSTWHLVLLAVTYSVRDQVTLNARSTSRIY